MSPLEDSQTTRLNTNPGSMPMTNNLVDELRGKLSGSQILTESSPGYEDAIKRWSDAAVKRAVGSLSTVGGCCVQPW